jgi:SPP1 gp7 family putative phage head morphogenesis protein
MPQRYNLGRMAREARRNLRRGIRLKAIEHSKKGERSYRAALRKMIRDVWRSIRLLPSVEDLDRLAAQARVALATATAEAIGTVRGILNTEAATHRAKWIAAVRSTIGIDLSAVVTETGIAREFGLIVKRNVDLITNLSDDVKNRIEQTVSRAVLNGETAPTLSKNLQEQFGIAARRADLIARDQIATAVSDLNKLRQEEAGIERYVWSSSLDERVREEHAALDGTEHSWKKPGPDNGMHPGQPINCRCTARAIID